MAVCRCNDKARCVKKILTLRIAMNKQKNAEEMEEAINIGLGNVHNSTADSLVIDTLPDICSLIQSADSNLQDERLAFFEAIDRRLDELEKDYADMDREDKEYHDKKEPDI